MNKIEDFYNRATDPVLKKLIGAVGNDYANCFDSFKKISQPKTTIPISKQRNVAKSRTAVSAGA